MRALLAFAAFLSVSCCSAANQAPLDSVTVGIIGEYETVTADVMSAACLDTSHEIHVRFKVIENLFGAYDKAIIEMLKCYHYGDNPFISSSNSGGKTGHQGQWLLLLREDKGEYREVYSGEVFKTNTGDLATCPLNGLDMFTKQGLPLTAINYLDPMTRDLSGASKYDKWYYGQNDCYVVTNNIAKMAKGIMVRDIVNKLGTRK